MNLTPEISLVCFSQQCSTKSHSQGQAPPPRAASGCFLLFIYHFPSYLFVLFSSNERLMHSDA